MFIIYFIKDEYFDDIAAAYREEIAELYSLGCRNVQFDDPLLAYFCAESMIKGMEELKIDHEALLDVYIRAYNNCIKDVPADMTVGLHLCRGNFKDGMHFSEGGYDRIAIKLFNQVNVNVFYVRASQVIYPLFLLLTGSMRMLAWIRYATCGYIRATKVHSEEQGCRPWSSLFKDSSSTYQTVSEILCF